MVLTKDDHFLLHVHWGPIDFDHLREGIPTLVEFVSWWLLVLKTKMPGLDVSSVTRQGTQLPRTLRIP